MGIKKSDPMWCMPKCEKCSDKVTNFVTGLCEQCNIIWTRTSGMALMRTTIENVEAVLVRISRDDNNFENIDAAFQVAIQEEHCRRMHKVQKFVKCREMYQANLVQIGFNPSWLWTSQ